MFTFNDHCNIEKVIQLNLVCDYLIIIFSEIGWDFDDNRIHVMGVIDDLSVMVIPNDVKFFGQEINTPKVGFFKFYV